MNNDTDTDVAIEIRGPGGRLIEVIHCPRHVPPVPESAGEDEDKETEHAAIDT
jgi:hypothetical protein